MDNLPHHTPYSFLESKAIEVGATQSRLIPAEGIIIENRGTFKCRSGCPYYGSSLVCPPHAPHPDEFRMVLKEYSHAFIVRFISTAKAREEISSSILQILAKPDVPSDLKAELQDFFTVFKKDSRLFHQAMLQLEKTAFNSGYPYAVALMPGPCTLCDSCNGIKGSCSHPTMRRFPADAVGINLIKTAKMAGMDIIFPFNECPDSIGVLLID